MAHQVFISYSHIDNQIANALCNKLENDGTKCWIAPRDIMPSKSWASEIAEAIPESKVMILILSSNSNASTQVLREVEIAVLNKLLILPIRIEDIMPTGGMSYYLATMQWIDVKGDKIDSKLSVISQKTRNILRDFVDEEEAEIQKKELLEKQRIERENFVKEKTVVKLRLQKEKEEFKKNQRIERKLKAKELAKAATEKKLLELQKKEEKKLLKIHAREEKRSTKENIAKERAVKKNTRKMQKLQEKEKLLQMQRESENIKDGGSKSRTNKLVVIISSVVLVAAIGLTIFLLRDSIFVNKNIRSTEPIDVTGVVLLNNLNARAAIAMGFNKQPIIEILEDNGEIGYTVLESTVPKGFAFGPEGSSYASIDFTDSLELKNTYDIENAKKAWAKAKDEIGFDTCTLVFLASQSELSIKTTSHIKNELEKNLDGLTVELRNVPFFELLALSNAEGINLNVFVWGADYSGPGGYLDLWSTEYEYHKSHWSNTDFDTLMETANTSNDPTEVWEAYIKAEELLAIERLVVPLYQKDTVCTYLEFNIEPRDDSLINQLPKSTPESTLELTPESTPERLQPEDFGWDSEMVVDIPDPVLREAIKYSLNKTIESTGDDIKVADMFNLRVVSVLHDSDNEFLQHEDTAEYIFRTDKIIEDLSGLEYARNLKVLEIRNNNISDISSLSNLTKLEELFINEQNISDFSMLSELKNLRVLDLSVDQGKIDISWLKELTKLDQLSLAVDKIEDYSALGSLVNLTYLLLDTNNIADVSIFEELQGLNKLDHLVLPRGVRNISGIEALTNLTHLEITNSYIEDIRALTDLNNLKDLFLDQNTYDNNLGAINNLIMNGCRVSTEEQ